MSEITELKDKMDKLKKEMLDEAKSAFSEFSKEIFEKYPDVKSFGWNQYTPYFNDGDECTFRFNGGDSYGINVNGKNDYSLDDDKLSNHDAIAEDISQTLKALGADFFKESFGDHVEVTVTESGVETSEYRHD